jgi:predicted TPR repeat methyltransferase
MSQLTRSSDPSSLRGAIQALEIALPAPGERLEQDEEWVVVHTDGQWKKIRLHDYADVYSVQGLYEKWIYEVFQCSSPQKIRELLAMELCESDLAHADLPILDLGAGNGCVAECLQEIGFKTFVGIDIYDEAADAADRDRPGLYDDYVVGDLTNPSPENAMTLDRYDFGCLTCVAALGFGDIPTEVFVEAYNRVRDGGLTAFTIKSDFLTEKDNTGFSALIRSMIQDESLRIARQEEYVHRIDADGNELRYAAIVGEKLKDARNI